MPHTSIPLSLLWSAGPQCGDLACLFPGSSLVCRSMTCIDSLQFSLTLLPDSFLLSRTSGFTCFRMLKIDLSWQNSLQAVTTVSLWSVTIYRLPGHAHVGLLVWGHIVFSDQGGSMNLCGSQVAGGCHEPTGHQCSILDRDCCGGSPSMGWLGASLLWRRAA